MAPSWNFPSGGGTGSNHTILVLNSIPITIDGTQVVSGDYVGVFFDSLGTLACAGYTLYEPSGGNMSITAWGADRLIVLADSEAPVWLSEHEVSELIRARHRHHRDKFEQIVRPVLPAVAR